MDIEEIISIPDRDQRFEEITVDCYDEYEVLSAFEVYLTDGLRTPFAATWGLPSKGKAAERVSVLGVADADEEGVRLLVRQSNGDTYDVPADQIWAEDATGTNAIVLEDYRTFVKNGGLPFDEDEEYDEDDEE